MDQTSNSPIPTSRLKTICTTACDAALSTASSYSHASTQQWNNDIIQSVLKSLIAESSDSSTSDDSGKPAASRYKFIVNSNIIQHLSEPGQSGEEGGVEGEGAGAGKKVGRRGMHSASGAYWNNERDGMWSCKYEGGVERGMDVVVSVMWVGV